MLTSAEALSTLARIDELGTFEAAARELHITASAVSQRIRAIEQQIGRVVVVRSKPARLTDAGEVLVRLARQIELLEREALDELGVSSDGERPVTIALAANADSLATWIHPALARFSARSGVVFDVSREDQEYTAELLASGRVSAAITAESDPVPGCTSTPLGAMIYRPVATPDFVARWFPNGVDAHALATAPLIDFNRRDTLQDSWLHSIGADGVRPPRHFVPSSTGFVHTVAAGMGWGMLPEAQCGALLRSGALVELPAGAPIRVELFWQQWDLRSRLLLDLAEEVRRAARSALAPPLRVPDTPSPHAVDSWPALSPSPRTPQTGG